MIIPFRACIHKPLGAGKTTQNNRTTTLILHSKKRLQLEVMVITHNNRLIRKSMPKFHPNLIRTEQKAMPKHQPGN